jgi:hypothetical protein
MEVGNSTPLTVEELLARSKAAAATKQKAGGSKIQQMLAGVEEDTVQLSGVQKLLKAQTDKAAKTKEPYTEQDWYLKMKVSQLRMQLDFYSKLGGDLGNSAMSSVEAEIRGLVQKQQAKLKASTDEAAAKQAELDKANAEKNLFAGLLTPDQLLGRSKALASGQPLPSKPLDPAVEALLKKSREAVNITT